MKLSEKSECDTSLGFNSEKLKKVTSSCYSDAKETNDTVGKVDGSGISDEEIRDKVMNESSVKTRNNVYCDAIKCTVNDTKSNSNKYDNKLTQIPTEIYDDGNKFVIFNEEILDGGNSRWDLTMCGYFVGHQMSVNGLKYNVKRMWGKI
uniref:RNA-directed DNA polymerase, eukaryota, reverse transcriptase zinc-binding domain protein n=1 Tax=Tanacetum cinerariifolium TaxID=118510 RepID=A0A699J8Q7_TANCI|nr:RNA-directed DNA polymerase, eukaryota, reverse transcriptase zinc-binding domain protein [Tanacetum cinerariifolium]